MSNRLLELTRLTRLLRATSEEYLSSTFRNAVGENGGGGFALVVLNGLVPWGEAAEGPVGWYDAIDKDGTASGDSAVRPLFCDRVAFDGACAEGRFALGDKGVGGTIDGLLTATSDRIAVLIETGERELRDECRQWLVLYCLAFYSRLTHLKPLQEGVRAQLSAREQEVLRWMAEGKSAEDVAEILGISAATVMFHYRNVALRFGTLNRTHTVVEAMRRGALQLN